MRHTSSLPKMATSGRGRLAFTPTVALLALTTVALIVRVLLPAPGGLWRDEALFLFVVRSPSWTAMMDFLRLHESHPPLFYILMRVWLSMAGNSDAAALALPVAAGVALVPVIYFVGTSLFSQPIGLIAAGLGPEDITLGEQSPSFGLVGVTRFNQIRAELASRFGLPDTSLVVHSRTPIFERLGASLFVPRDGGAALEPPDHTASGPGR
jgi:hypothetical protein